MCIRDSTIIVINNANAHNVTNADFLSESFISAKAAIILSCMNINIEIDNITSAILAIGCPLKIFTPVSYTHLLYPWKIRLTK